MSKLPFLSLTSTINDQRINVNSLNDRIGDLALLNTAGDSDLVQAINFVDSDTNARIDSADAYFKGRIVSEVNTLNLRIDSAETDLNARVDSADTYFKARIVSEVNTLNTTISNNDSDINARVDSADAYFKGRILSEVNTLNNTINNVDSDLGDRTSLNSTNKSSIVAAYNELRTRVDLIDSAQAVSLDSAFNSISILEGRADSNDTNFVTRVRGSISSGGDISYNPATGVFSIDVEQIYTKANFDSDLDLAFATNAVTTTDLTEGTNLYYTTARVNSAFDTRLATKSTTNLTEGNNLYYTSARADSAAKNAISVTDAGGDGSMSYNSSTGVITYTGPSASEVRAHLSAVDAGGDGSFSYNSSTGAFTYTGPSAAEVRAHFTEGEGIDISSGIISGEDATTTNKGIASFNSASFSVTSGAVSVKAGGISNAQLVNSSITINGSAISLGGSVTTTTSIVDDTSTNATRYLTFTDQTSGAESTLNVSSTKLYFNPSTGDLNATNFNSLSDATMKEDVISLDNSIDILKRINPVKFNWKDNKKTAYGVIAQEIEQVIPEIVSVNDRGEKSVAYQQIIAFLVDAVKTQQSKIEELENKINK